MSKINSEIKSMPKPNVEYAGNNSDNLTEKQINGMLCNPLYTGIDVFPTLLTEDNWIKSAKQFIEKEGIDQFLVNMLYMLKETCKNNLANST